jgi:DNA-directed RNA polymerase specialized sigma24 family protein
VELPPFQVLLDDHAADVHRFLVASVGATDADDCYQETWIAALRAYPRLVSAENLRGWLFTIAHRKALDHLRARRRQPIPVGDDLPEPGHPGRDGAAGPAGDPALGTGPDPELWQAVAALPPKQRTAVALRFIVDADYRQVAAMMGTSEDAARRNVHEALKRLRREELDV